MQQSIDTYDFSGKKAIVRVDFNVPLNEKFEITDDTRIRAAIPTLKKVLEKGGSLIIMSHLGRPKGVTEKFSLKHILGRVEELLGVPVKFADDCMSADDKVAALKPGEVLVLENLRFYAEEEGKPRGLAEDATDEEKKAAKAAVKESQKKFVAKLASYADCYINDAFGTAHRAHASTALIAKYFPEDKMFGYVMEGEIKAIDRVLKTPEHPVTAIIGGAKVSSKIGIIEHLFDVVDNMIIGGGMVYTFVKAQGGKIGHVGFVKEGVFMVGDTVTLHIDEEKRAATCKNHSATHLLQKALRMVLGTHVEQAGSYVSDDRLRFDFTHFAAMTKDELAKTEDLVNKEIAAELPVVTEVMSVEDAKKSGAMALFGEKYGESVRVVSMGDFSKELCGGTHVANTGNITAFKIISETGIAAGVRRIEALTAKGVFDYYKTLEQELAEAAKAARSDPAGLAKKIESMHDEIKSLSSENEKLKAKLANSSLGDILNTAADVNGVRVLAAKVPDVDMNGLRNLGDQMKEKLGECFFLLASVFDGKVNLVAMATDGAVKKGAHAGNLIKAAAAVVGGGGGGRPNMAQAGGKNPAAADEAVAKAKELAEGMLK